jgi:hypothetical protein
LEWESADEAAEKGTQDCSAGVGSTPTTVVVFRLWGCCKARWENFVALITLIWLQFYLCYRADCGAAAGRIPARQVQLQHSSARFIEPVNRLYECGNWMGTRTSLIIGAVTAAMILAAYFAYRMSEADFTGKWTKAVSCWTT